MIRSPRFSRRDRIEENQRLFICEHCGGSPWCGRCGAREQAPAFLKKAKLQVRELAPAFQSGAACNRLVARIRESNACLMRSTVGRGRRRGDGRWAATGLWSAGACSRFPKRRQAAALQNEPVLPTRLPLFSPETHDLRASLPLTDDDSDTLTA